MKFNMAMNLEQLRNTTLERKLQKANNKTLNETLAKYRYILSSKHLRIETKSQNETKHNFSWYAVNLTKYEIQMQLDFEDPLYVSLESADTLEIAILPPALHYFRTLVSNLLIRNPTASFSLHLPP